MFGDIITPSLGIKPWATPTDAYSIQAKLNLKGFEIGYSRLYESHTSTIGYPPTVSIFSKETIFANHIQNLYATYSFVSANERFALHSTVSAQEFKVYPRSLYLNQYSGYFNAYKYERNRTIKIEEQINYNITDKFNIVGGFSYEYLHAIPITSDLPYKYDESKKPEDQNIYYPGTDTTDVNGNDLTIIQDIYIIDYYNIGSYLQLQYQIFSKLTLTAGTRYDYNSRYKSTVNPRVGLVFKPINKITLKILYGHAFLAPSPFKAYQYYGSFFHITNATGDIIGLASGYWHLPNPDLEPEKRTSYDIHSMYQVNPNFAISLNGYYGQISNLIGAEGYIGLEFKGVPVDYVTKTINKGDATAYGGTFRLDYKGNIAANFNLDVFAAYTYSDGDIADNPLIFSAEHTFKGGVGLQFKNRFNIFSKVLYRTESHYRYSTSDTPITNDAFAVVNLTANVKVINKQKFKAGLFVNVYNLLNSRYYNVGWDFFEQTPQDPIKLDFGLKLNF